jgi:hypothetical protein
MYKQAQQWWAVTSSQDTDEGHCSHTDRGHVTGQDTDEGHCSHTDRGHVTGQDTDEGHCSHANRGHVTGSPVDHVIRVPEMPVAFERRPRRVTCTQTRKHDEVVQV